jgi:hypothetical protein
MSRNILNNPTRTTGRDITNTGTRSFANNAIEPVEITEIDSRNSTIGLKGLSGFTANKILKVNSAGDALVYADDSDTQYTATSPLLLTGTAFSLSQGAFNITTSLADGDYIPIFDTSGNFDRITTSNFKTQTGIVNPADVNDFGTNSQAGNRNVGLASQELRLLGQSTIITGKLDQQGTLSSASFMVMDSVLFNTEAPLGSSNGFRSLKLDSTGYSTYGYVNATDFGSDIATFVNNDTVKFSSIGSMTSDCIFGLYSGNRPFLMSQPYNRSFCVIGLQAQRKNAYSAEVALAIVNDTDDLNSNDARLRIESRSDAHDPVLELVSNLGTDSATRYFSYIYSKKPGIMVLESTPGIEIVSKLYTNNTNQFTAIGTSFTPGNQIAIEYHYLDDPFSASTHIWRNQIGTGGDLHYDYRSNGISGTWVPNGYVSPGTGFYAIMNFTGQHRCIPEEEELYVNIDSYIGMVVEATGKYNSIDYANTEEEEIVANKVEAYTDVETRERHEEKINYVKLKRKSQKTFSNTNPTIDEAQPVIRLSSKLKSKTVYGVISSREITNDDGKRVFSVGTFSSIVGELQDNRLVINSIGEGGILVCNEGGDIENGDYLCSSSTPGIAMRQDDDLLHNYTIAKATMDYNFIDTNERKLIGATYHCG